MAININIPSQFLDYDSLSAFPATGSAKILYVAKDTNKLYRWDGSTYVEVSATQASSWGSITGNLASQTDLVSELDTKVAKETGKGLSANDYTTTEKNKLAGIEAGAEVNVNADWNATSGDAQILNKPDLSGYATTSDLTTGLASKQATLVSGTNIKTIEGNSLLGSGNIDLSKSDVGLGNVDNTSDANKPISSATQTALDAKENTITAGTTSQYYRGDKSFQTLDKTAVGLSNVDNTSDANKPVSTATQTALNAKQNSLTLTTTGTSGAATLVGATLNIPQYSGGGSSGILGIHSLLPLGSGTSTNQFFAGTNVSSGIITANRLVTSPYIPSQNITTQSLSINCVTLSAGSLVRILIYSDVNGFPNTKLYESTDLDCSTTGAKTVLTTFNFVAGTIYWIGYYSNGTPSLTSMNSASMMSLQKNNSFFPPAINPTVINDACTFGSAPTTYNLGNAFSIGNNVLTHIRKA